MDLFIIELVCWGGLLFFFWALKDGLGSVETDIESLGVLQGSGRPKSGAQTIRYYKPELTREQIGSYRGQPIYRYVVIDGRTYQFDRVFPPESTEFLADEERCVVPGLVYLADDRCEQTIARV